MALARDSGYRYGEVDLLNTLGTVQYGLGRHVVAVDDHRQALTIARETAYRYGETEALIGLAAACRTGADADHAVGLTGACGYQVLEGQALVIRAVPLPDRIDEAGRDAERALACHQQTGHRLGAARALLVLGYLADLAGRHDQGQACYNRARAMFADIGASWTEHARALLPSKVAT